MRVGILGATGMLGHHVALAAQAEGHELVVLHRARARLDRLRGLRWQGRICDLDEPATLVPSLRGLDAVVNAAAYYPTAPRPLAAELATAMAQMNVFLDACAQAAVPRILYVGGSIALPRDTAGKPGHEGLLFAGEPADRTPYVQVKWAMDRLCRERAARGEPIVIGIPAMTLGEHDHGPSTGRLLVEIANRSLPAFVAGERNVVWAGDAGRGLLLALRHGRIGERYLLTGSNVSMADLVAQIADVAGVPLPRCVPLAVARAAAKVQEIRFHMLGGAAPKLSATALAVMAAGQFLSGAKAERELGYTPSIGLRETIERSYRWFVQNDYIRPMQH
jgi:nucleoside-diphosphate-sugar epimerase